MPPPDTSGRGGGDTPPDPEEDRLLDEAIDLAIRMQNDPDNPVPQRLVQAWRARSPLHAQVWSKVAHIHDGTGAVLRQQRASAAAGPNRRVLVLGGLAGLGAAATGATFGPAALRRMQADFTTGTGEIRSIALPDGSTAVLGPDSALALDFRQERRVDLLEGMCCLFVGAAPRPLVLRVGAMTVRTGAASFDVSRDAGIVSLLVGQQMAEVTTPGGSQTLHAGEKAVFDPRHGTLDTTSGGEARIGLWRDRQLIAEAEPVAAIAARIGRWLPGTVVIADPSLGDRRVSGLFDLSDPLRALRAVAEPAGGKVRQIPPLVTLITRI